MTGKRSLVPDGGNDDVTTPPALAAAIIAHYGVTGQVLDPCRGTGSFWREGWEWCEIKEGRDFLIQSAIWDRSNQPRHFDWVCSNPPYSQFRIFTQCAMAIADNVVWLAPINHFWLTARLRDIDEAGFGIREIARVKTPPKPWPQSGFAIAAVRLQRGWTGDVKMSRLT